MWRNALIAVGLAFVGFVVIYHPRVFWGLFCSFANTILIPVAALVAVPVLAYYGFRTMFGGGRGGHGGGRR